MSLAVCIHEPEAFDNAQNYKICLAAINIENTKVYYAVRIDLYMR